MLSYVYVRHLNTISLCPQVSCANKPTPVPQIHVPTAASAPPVSPNTAVPAHLSSPEIPANRTSMSVMQARHPARMAVFASTRSAATGASARQSTRASTVRAVTCPATRRPVIMEAPASRKERPAMNVPVCQVETLHYIHG